MGTTRCQRWFETGGERRGNHWISAHRCRTFDGFYTKVLGFRVDQSMAPGLCSRLGRRPHSLARRTTELRRSPHARRPTSRDWRMESFRPRGGGSRLTRRRDEARRRTFSGTMSSQDPAASRSCWRILMALSWSCSRLRDSLFAPVQGAADRDPPSSLVRKPRDERAYRLFLVRGPEGRPSHCRRVRDGGWKKSSPGGSIST